MDNPKINLHKSRNSQLGFTMVELLVAMGLSAGLLFGVLQIFDANSRGSRMQTAFSEVQEGGRIAVEILARDIRMASSWGCNKDSSTVSKNIPNAASNVGWGVDALRASNNVGSTAVGLVTVKPATDMLTVMGAFGISNALVRQPYMLSIADSITINTGANIPQGTDLVISDCQGTDIFTNTEVNTSTSGLVSHAAPLGHIYRADARLGIPFTHQYFIGQVVGATSWSLYRRVNEAGPEELVRNVTDMQIVYGVGNVTVASTGPVPSTPFVSQFLEQPSSSQLKEVISVRMQLVVDSEGLMSDGAPLQKTFLATANIRNNSLKVVPPSKPNF